MPKFRRVEKLVVTPYGAYYGMLNREIIGLPLTDHAQKILEEADKNLQQHVNLVISSGVSKIVSTYLPGTVSAGVEKALPYYIHFQFSSIYPDTRDPIPHLRRLADAEPKIVERLQARKPIYPRHLLDIGEGATLVDIEREYKRLKDIWVPVSQREGQEDAVFALTLLKGIEMAYQALKYEQDFKAFAEENFDLYKSFAAKKQ